jgi:predicted PurR-regulated permease PerM
MEPDMLREIYRLSRENNQMLHSIKRHAFWGTILKIGLYLLALGIPIWLYFTYLSPIVKQFEETISTATGTKVELQGQFAEWATMFDQFRERFTGGSSTATSSQQ